VVKGTDSCTAEVIAYAVLGVIGGVISLHEAPAYLVGTSGAATGASSHRRLGELGRSGQSDEALSSVTGNGFVHTHPDHPIDVVLDRLSESRARCP
jgi:hypothetical protein